MKAVLISLHQIDARFPVILTHSHFG